VLRTTAVQVNEYRAHEHKAIPSKLSPRPEIEVKDGDILITRAGPMNRVGISCWVNNTPPRLMLSDKIVRFHSIADEMLPAFVVLALNAGWTKRLIEQAKTGMAASQVNISQTDLRGFWLPVCSKAEQSRIVTRVEELMRLCDALEAKGQLEATQHEQLIRTLLGTLSESETPEQLADNWDRIATHFDLLLDRPQAVDALEQTILQLAVRGLLAHQDPQDEPASELLKKIRAEKDKLIAQGKIKRDKPLPPIGEDEQPFALPTGWKWARLGSLANFIDYRGKTPTKTETGVPLITAKNVRQGFINRGPREFIAESAYDGWMTRGFPKVGDLLFTTEAPLGNVAAIDIHERFALAQRVICLGVYERGMSGTLCAFMQSPWMQDALAGQASGVTAQGIKSARLQLMLIPVPPLAEQSRIVTRVAQLRRLCFELRQRLATAQSTQTHLAEALVQAVA
jgi:type I restriction enzyme S subunit